MLPNEDQWFLPWQEPMILSATYNLDNDFLNYSPSNAGYAVFGKVIEGIDIVDKIRLIPTGSGGFFPTDVPQTQVIIESVKVLP